MARPNCPEALVAHRISGSTCFYFGDFAAAHDHFQKTIELYDQARHGDLANWFGQLPRRAAVEAYDALALWGLGKVDEARRVAERAITDSWSAAHAPTTAYALGQRMGRKPKLTGAQQTEARKRRAEGATLAELARSYHVGKSTILRLTA